MSHKDRKTQRMRGSRTHGYGNAQKHRGAGSRGGRGMAGSKKHKWMWVSKNLPNYFGRKGFVRHKSIVKRISTINVGKIDEELDKWLKDGKVKKKGKIVEINLKKMGFDKLLGSGSIKQPVTVTVDTCSKSAREKIEKSGGKVKPLTSQKEEFLGVGDESGVSETVD